MRRLLIASMLFLAILSSSAQAQSYLPSINIVLTEQTPNPVEPGQTVNLEVTIENNGYSEAQNMVIEFIPSEPFQLVQGESATRTFTKIPATGSLKVTYRLYVDSSAVSNNYPLEFRAYQNLNPDNYIKKLLTVNVQGVPELVLESVRTIPEDLEPGGIATLLFKIRNVGTGTVRSAKATLDSESEEIIPVYSAGSVFVGDIALNDTAQVSMQVSVDSSAEYKTYVTGLTMEYKDENNQDQTTTFSVGIPVTGSINLDIIKIEPNYQRQRIEVEVANKGTTDATSVEARLVIDNETVDVDYTSSIRATKKTTFDFPLILKGRGQLVIDYIGPGIEKNTETMDVILDFSGQGGDWTTMLLIPVFILVAAVGWRKKWHQKIGIFKKRQ